jgi:hypothetical protein
MPAGTYTMFGDDGRAVGTEEFRQRSSARASRGAETLTSYRLPWTYLLYRHHTWQSPKLREIHSVRRGEPDARSAREAADEPRRGVEAWIRP